MLAKDGPPDTLAAYLARFLAARRGYQPGIPVGGAALPTACDFVLTRAEPNALSIACVVDREADPGRRFGLDPAEATAVARTCREHARMLGFKRVNVTIAIYEVGPGATAPEETRRLSAYRRTSAFAKASVTACAVDPVTLATWSNRPFLARVSGDRWLRTLLATSRLSDADLVPVATAPQAGGRPTFTLALLVLLAAIFAAEIVLGVDPWSKLLQPSTRTLLAFGALTRTLALGQGQWWRLLTAPMLHADATHLLFNGLALFLVGRLAERVMGSAWFAATFAVSALCGSLLSIAIDDANLVRIGASGGIVGLFAATFVLGFRFPPGVLRSRLWKRAIYTLVPALIPMTAGDGGMRIDYGAHFGGAIGGAVLGLAMLGLWPRTAPLPRFQRAAAAVAGVLGILTAGAIWPDAANYRTFALAINLYEPWPATDAAAKSQSAAMLASKPRDPRVRLVRALALIDAKDLPGAEGQLKAALAEPDMLTLLPAPEFEARLRLVLAAVLLDEGRRGEADTTAGPACALGATGPFRPQFDRLKLCR